METLEQIREEIESNRQAYMEADDEFDQRLFYKQMLRAQYKLRSFDVV